MAKIFGIESDYDVTDRDVNSEGGMIDNVKKLWSFCNPGY